MQAGFSESGIMSSCVMPRIRGDANPVVLLNCFDRMEICISFAGRCRLKVWAIDVLGWGFSDLEGRPLWNAALNRYHLYQLWKSHIKRPMESDQALVQRLQKILRSIFLKL
ncbi:alpha/beta-Hydrolases superfamily protein [Salvia divinorum]|uniref:Alpha/beta-Hydrolases superfamily protein n=1 Tax=Salvia divinorum TaxID=28513 RepID=A0ABD1HRA1_SALDI